MNLLLTSKRTHDHKNVQHARLQYNARYHARDMYYSVLETLEDACYFMNTVACRERYNALFDKAENMMGIISEYCQKDARIRECLEMLIMAGYKENLYFRLYQYQPGDAYPCMTRSMEIFFKSYFFEKLSICNKFTHVHNPSHYVFDEDEYYEFHEIEKKQQKNIVEIYRDAMYAQYGDDSDYDEDDML
jgi:hypothetical protein